MNSDAITLLGGLSVSALIAQAAPNGVDIFDMLKTLPAINNIIRLFTFPKVIPTGKKLEIRLLPGIVIIRETSNLDLFDLLHISHLANSFSTILNNRSHFFSFAPAPRAF